MSEIITIRDGEIPLIKWIKEERIAKKRNVNVIITGNPGTGKTMSGLTIASSLCPDLTIKFIATCMEELLNILLKILKDPERYVGQVVIYEEPQEEQYKMRSTTVEAVSFVQILSTFRSLRLILIMTTPRQGHFQKEGKDYFDVWLQTQGINEDRKLCFLKPKFGSWNENANKMFWAFMRVDYKSIIYVNTSIAMVLPPRTLIDYYEQTKRKFQQISYEGKLKKIQSKYIKAQPRVVYPYECQGRCKNKWNARTKNPTKCPTCGSQKIKLIA